MKEQLNGLYYLKANFYLFGASHDMIFNQKKSASVYFISKTLNVPISLMCT